MEIKLAYSEDTYSEAEVKVVGVYAKKDGKGLAQSWSNKEDYRDFTQVKSSKNFTGKKGSSFLFTNTAGDQVLAVGLGEKSKLKAEALRRAIAGAYKLVAGKKYTSVCFDMASFNSLGAIAKSTEVAYQSLRLSSYKFDKYLAEKKEDAFKSIELYVSDKKAKRTLDKSIEAAENLASSVLYTRDLVNEAPNILHSEEYAKRIQADVKTALKGKGVKVKILGKADLKKEKMGLFLSVNAGSSKQPQLVHLTYTPKKVTKNTKHLALVGKGLTFDTGGYSLKPSSSIIGMKFDMGGSATMYGAFRAAVLNNSPYKITLVLGITDNAISSDATFPDSIVTGRNGTTVEILNTDAEGRLVLADCLDYTCDLKPDYLIDAATLTGACLMAFGKEVCAVMGNDDKFIKKVLTSAKDEDEASWQLPIQPEWKEDMKSPIADLKNIGGSRHAGTSKAAAFLENFIKNDVKWAHLDIAGVAADQAHLPYAPKKGGSGAMVRSLHNLLMNAK